MRRLVLHAGIVLLAVLAAIAAGASWMHANLQVPASFPPQTRFDVASGESLRGVSGRLEERGLVPSALALRIWARWHGVDRSIHAGPYAFDPPLAPAEILEALVEGRTMAVRITFPEGWTAREMARRVEKAGLGTADRFIELAYDAETAKELGVPGKTLEGYLLPETYRVRPDLAERDLLELLVAAFRSAIEPIVPEETRNDPDALHEIVTLASIVEKETGKEEERPWIAAVFRNRLDLGMPLQADPTVIYGVPDFDGNLTRDHLRTSSPWNTYMLPGLPEGPIANPGIDAIRAAADPPDVPYLYFVSRGDGSHVFSETLAEHERNVDVFQRNRR